MIGIRTLNPVLDRELRQRSRSMRSMIILTLFLGLLIAVAYLAYEGSQATSGFTGDPISALTRRTGRSVFEWVLAAELTILLFIIPGISASSVAGERDRQTLIPLQVTLVGPVQIFFGKVFASSSFLLLLLIASAPVVAVPYLVGGISLTQVLLSLLALGVTGFLVAVIGVGCSSFFRRTQTATLAAYAVVLGMVLGSVILLAVTAVIDSRRGEDVVEPRIATLYANPFLAVTDAAGEIGERSSGPFSPIKEVVFESQVGTNVIIEGDFAFNPITGEEVELSNEISGLPLWARSLLTQTALAAVFAIVGVYRLRAPTRELSS